MSDKSDKKKLIETVLDALKSQALKPDTTVEHIEINRPCVEAFRGAEGIPHMQPGDDIYYSIHLRVNNPQGAANDRQASKAG
jgi:hypothetical protein